VEVSLASLQHARVPTPSKHSRHPAFLALGNAIRANRRRCGFTQEELAEKAGLDRSYLGQIERGENSVALLPLVQIATVLETTVTALMAEAGL
jgi:transcriptional regulator with XRE-family HTH domain